MNNKRNSISFKLIIVVLFVFMVKHQAYAQLSLDPGFNTTDLGFGIGDGFDLPVTALAVQSDGKIIAGGNFQSYHSISRKNLARVNPDGSLDMSFDAGSGFNGNINAIAIQDDGKVIIAGNFTTVNGQTRNRIVRLNSDGTIDGSFSIGTGFPNEVFALALRADQKIMVAGSFISYNGTFTQQVARLNTNGTLDNTWNWNGGCNVRALAVQTDNKVVVCMESCNFRLARLQANGSADATFVVGSGLNNVPRAIAIQPDGKIIVGGDFTAYNGTTSQGIVRINTSGTIDAGFLVGSGFDAGVNKVRSIVLQPDGKIVVGGTFATYNGVSSSGLIRLETNGIRDASLTVSPGSGVNRLVIAPGGEIYCGTSNTWYGLNPARYLLKLNSNGQLESSFYYSTGVSGLANAEVRAIGRQSDGKWLLAGKFYKFNNEPYYGIVRLNMDGTADPSFLAATGFFNASSPASTDASAIYAMIILPDDKIVLAGGFTRFNGTNQNYIVRLNADGSVDNTFNSGTGFNNLVYSLLLQPDGKILVGGNFTTYKGVAANQLIRLFSDGNRDNSFNAGSGFLLGAPAGPRCLALQADGSIIAGGIFGTVNGLTRNRLCRISSTGTLDPSYNSGSGFQGNLDALLLQPDGKLLAGGSFSTFNGSALNDNLIRLTVSGSLDPTFSLGASGITGSVFTLAFDSLNILAGGNFTSFNGTPCNRLVRINSGGLVDPTFNTAAGFDNSVLSMYRTADGQIMIGGGFTSFNSQGRNRIARFGICTSGVACNDNDTCTVNDIVGTDCNCAGTYIDSDNDGICNSLDNCPTFSGQIGDPCDDNNICTVGDSITPACLCAGVFIDSDNDNICDATDNCDFVPGVIGTLCNDSNLCTINDSLDVNCNCTGIYSDLDSDGLCDALDFHPDSWIRRTNFSGISRHSAASFVVNSKLYIGTGLNGANYLSDLWEYDPTLDSWTQKADFGGGIRFGAVGFSVNGKGYIALGDNNNPTFPNDCWEYDPTTNTWLQKANFGGTGRYYASSFVIGNKAYVGIGNDGNLKSDFWEFDPAVNTWISRASAGGGVRDRAAAFALNGKGYIVTGRQNTSTDRTDMWEYNPMTNSWIQRASLPSLARRGAVAFDLGSVAYVTAGQNGSTFLNDIWQYNQKANKWIQKNSGGIPARAYAVAESLGDVGFIGTGQNPNPMKDFWRYTPDLILVNGSTTLCSGDSLILTSSMTGTYQWSTGATSRSITVQQTGTYTLTVNGNYTAAVSVKVLEKPKIYSSGPTTLCSGATVSLSTDPGLIYLWSTGATTQSISVSTAGTYIVTVSSPDGCSQTSAPTVVTTNPAVTLFSDDFTSSAVGGSGTWTASFFGTFTAFPVNFFNIQSNGYPVNGNTMQIVNYTSNTTGAFGYALQGSPNYTPIVYRSTTISGYSDLRLSFDWRCNGQAGADFGRILVFNNSSGQWGYLGSELQGSSGVQSISNFLIPAFVPTSTTLTWGFYFQSDASIVNQPGLSVDNIILTGRPNIAGVNTAITRTCPGNSISLNYLLCGSFTASNTLTFQLSDANGSFANPVVLGSTLTNVSGSYFATIPANTPLGNGYRIRVLTSSPALTGNDNGTDITIGLPQTWYADGDADGYGEDGNSVTSCSVPGNLWALNNLDCNDNNALVNPVAIETCNLIDDNCNTQIDEGLAAQTYYADADADGYGNPIIDTTTCVGAPVGFVLNNQDCNDANPTINPAAAELFCNGIDDNCNGQPDGSTIFSFDNATANGSPLQRDSLCDANEFTIEMWVRKDYDNSNGSVIIPFALVGDPNNPAQMTLDVSPSTVSFGFNYNGTGLSFNLNGLIWNHIAFVKSASEIKGYLNGVLMGSSPVVNPSQFNGKIRYFTIGGNFGFGTPSIWLGDLDQVRIWSTTRTAAEIAANYKIEITTPQPDLFANYTFNEGIPGGNNTSRTFIQDFSGNNQHLYFLTSGAYTSPDLVGNANNYVADPFDTDGDGVDDCDDLCPADSNKSVPGICGCGVPDTDTDNDGTPDCVDGCPNIAGNVGDPCNDNNPLTNDDQIMADCNCGGIQLPCQGAEILLTSSNTWIESGGGFSLAPSPSSLAGCGTNYATFSGGVVVPSMWGTNHPVTTLSNSFNWNTASGKRAFLEFTVDDDVLILINGDTVLYDANCLAQYWGTTDITSYLVSGSNSISIRATDCGGCFTVYVLLYSVDETVSYADNDGDGFGNPSLSSYLCPPPAGYVFNNLDCDDANIGINPAVAEICNNGIDENCNGLADDNATAQDYYIDADGDSYGDVNALPVTSCGPILGYVTNNTDCNDGNSSIYPGATDICDNGIDEDCSGSDSTCTSNPTLTIRFYIEGYYSGGSLMVPVLYNNGLSLNPADCDSITIELHDPLSPSSVLFSQPALLQTDGYSTVALPVSLIGNSYFLVVKHRNSIETWSKLPVVIITGLTLFDFTQ